jgi:hypothetical protein
MDKPIVHADMGFRALGNGRNLVQTWCGQGEYEVADAELFTRSRREPTCPRCRFHVNSCMYSDVS